MAEEAKPTLVALLADAGQAELDDVNKRIAEIKRQIEQFCGQRKAEIAYLLLVRRVLERKLSPRVKKEKKAQEPKQRDGTELQKRIFDLLTQEGPMPVPAIAAGLNVHGAGVGAAVSPCPWFVRANGEVRIAKADERA